MKTSKRFLFIIFTLAWVTWFPVFVCYTVSHSLPIKHGPGSGAVNTIGVFQPAGYILFEVNPELYSVEGYYHATFVIEPLLNEDMREKGIVWPVLRVESNRGWPWGDTIAKMGSISSEEIDFDIYLDIPDNLSLSGQRVPIVVTANIVYPGATGFKSFANYEKDIDETVVILINNDEGKPASAWKKFWVHKVTTGETVALIIWIFGFIGVIALHHYAKQKVE